MDADTLYPPGVWARGFGSVEDDRGWRVRVDSDENAYVTGSVNGSIGLEGTITKTGGPDGSFVSKFDGSGHAIWTNILGPELGCELALAGDHLVVACFVITDTDFGLGKVASPSLAVVALDKTSGHALWQTSFALSGSPPGLQGLCVSGNAAGEIAAHATVTGAINVGPTRYTGGTYSVLVKMDPTGAVEWSKRTGTEPLKSAVAVDETGAVYLAGGFVDAVLDLGGGSLTNAGASDVFEAKFDPSGAHLWSVRQGDADIQIATDLSLDGDRAIVAGEFNGSVSFDTSHTSNGNKDVFIAALDANSGKYIWSQSWGGAQDDQFARVSAGALGILATSEVQTATPADDAATTVFIGGIPLHARDYFDAFFLASFDAATGAVRSARPLGIGNGGLVTSIVQLGSGDAVLAGYFTSQFKFDTGAIPVTGGDALSADVFLARYAH